VSPKRVTAAFLVLLLCGVGWLVRADDAPVLAARLSSPSLDHWAGTDHLGRDVLNRTLRATAGAAAVAIPAWAIATGLGAFMGLIAAVYHGRLYGQMIDWGIKVVFATPFLLVLLGLGVVAGRGMSTLFLVVVLLGWASPARHARAVARDALAAPYTHAALSMGFSAVELARYVLLPTCLKPVVAASGALIVEILALDMALTLFGFGPPPPAPTLGTLLSDGLRFLGTAPWTLLTPICVVCVVCLCVRAVLQGAPSPLGSDR
jgi:ABC-type dipeptide/oligopeptide/nickel transport system permease subunit